MRNDLVAELRTLDKKELIQVMLEALNSDENEQEPESVELVEPPGKIRFARGLTVQIAKQVTTCPLCMNRVERGSSIIRAWLVLDYRTTPNNYVHKECAYRFIESHKEEFPETDEAESLWL